MNTGKVRLTLEELAFKRNFLQESASCTRSHKNNLQVCSPSCLPFPWKFGFTCVPLTSPFLFLSLFLEGKHLRLTFKGLVLILVQAYAIRVGQPAPVRPEP